MELEIVHYPHPTLSHRSKPLKKVDRTIRDMLEQMFELMYQHQGIGLAANQVDLPFQMFVVNESGMKGEGEELVFINPVLSRPKGSEEAEEGCLSLPGVYGKVVRPKQIRIQGYGLDGKAIDRVLDGMLSRVCQHEFDHLQGTMFIDRMSEWARSEIEPSVHEFEIEFDHKRQVGRIPDDHAIQERLAGLEKEYCG